MDDQPLRSTSPKTTNERLRIVEVYNRSEPLMADHEEILFNDQDLVSPDVRQINNWFTCWYFLFNLFDQMWTLLICFSLVRAFGSSGSTFSLAPVGAYFLFTKVVSHSFISWVNSWIQAASRTKILYWSVLIQFLTISVSAFLLLALEAKIEWPPSLTEWDQLAAPATFVLLLFFNLFGSVAFLLLRKSIELDWIPTVNPLFQLVNFQARLGRVKLICEIFGPLTTAILVLISHSIWSAIVVIGATYMSSFLVQLVSLRMVLKIRPSLMYGDEPRIHDAPNENQTPLYFLWTHFRNMLKDRAIFLILSNMLMSMTLLIPTNPILIAFLLSRGTEYISIGAFIAGASLVRFAAARAPLFNWLTNRLGLLFACRILLFFNAVFILVSSIMFEVGPTLQVENSVTSPQVGNSTSTTTETVVTQVEFQEWSKWILMSCVAISCGIYDMFNMGKMNVLQLAIRDEEVYRIAGKIDAGLVEVMKMVILLGGTLISNPDDITALVWISFGANIFGSVVFFVWSLNKSTRNAIIIS